MSSKRKHDGPLTRSDNNTSNDDLFMGRRHDGLINNTMDGGSDGQMIKNDDNNDC